MNSNVDIFLEQSYLSPGWFVLPGNVRRINNIVNAAIDNRPQLIFLTLCLDPGGTQLLSFNNEGKSSQSSI